MSTVVLTAKKREKSTKSHLKGIRNEGNIPAVIYGLGAEPETVEVESIPVKKYLNSGNTNQVIELKIDDKPQQVLLKDHEVHPVQSNKILHLDFLRVNSENPVVVKVPIRHSGTPVGVKNEGGQFSIMKRFVKVKCKIDDIPEAFEQDISGLRAGTVVYVRDLSFEKGSFITPEKTALYGVGKGRAKDAAPAEDAKEAKTEEAPAEESAAAE